MVANYIKAVILAVSFSFFLSGCTFSLLNKKTELNLTGNQKNQAVQNNQENSEKQTGPEKTTTPADITPTSNNTAKKNSVVTPTNIPTNSQKPKIINRLVNWGYTLTSGRTIDTIIIHSSYNAVGSNPHDLDDIINKEYKPAGVSSHYIISRDGKIYRLVEDKNIAYHAGESKMPDGRINVNNFSIGIEIVETKAESPSSVQYASLKNLLAYLKGQYKIKYVLGHSDIAPGRKDDPWNFDFNQL